MNLIEKFEKSINKVDLAGLNLFEDYRIKHDDSITWDVYSLDKAGARLILWKSGIAELEVIDWNGAKEPSYQTIECITDDKIEELISHYLLMIQEYVIWLPLKR